MKRIFAVVALFFTIGVASSMAQSYNTGIGIRAGFESGLSVKHFLNENAALERILGSRWRGVTITGLYEVHNDIADAPGLRWYYGGGAHIGFYDSYRDRPWGDPNRDYTVVGIDGILGLEYTFSEVPINLSLDWKPAFVFNGDRGFWADGAALSIRFVF